jgi:hypothetical protein
MLQSHGKIIQRHQYLILFGLNAEEYIQRQSH